MNHARNALAHRELGSFGVRDASLGLVTPVFIVGESEDRIVAGESENFPGSQIVAPATGLRI